MERSDTESESFIPQPAGPAHLVIQLQRALGNRAVQQVLEEAGLQRARFGEDDAAALKPAFIENPNAREGTQKECREIAKTGLLDLLRQKSRAEGGKEPPSDKDLKATIAGYEKYRLKRPGGEFEFTDEDGELTKGEKEPEELTAKVEDAVVSKVQEVKGWHLFGLSIMDAQRSALIAVDNRKPGARRVYWLDRTQGGFEEVTGRLDQRITNLTRELWSAQPPDQRHRTRAAFWTFVAPES